MMELKRRSFLGFLGATAVAPDAIARTVLPVAPPVLPSDPAICFHPPRKGFGLTAVFRCSDLDGDRHLERYLRIRWNPIPDLDGYFIIRVNGEKIVLLRGNVFNYRCERKRQYNIALSTRDYCGIESPAEIITVYS